MSYVLWYCFIICAIVLVRERGQRSTVDRFLVAERRLGGTLGSGSIAASWIWAPAIFISSQTGYRWGFAGLLWFCLPNMLALLIFAPLATKVRRALPEGYSYIEFLGRGDRTFQKLQLLLQLAMQIAIFGIQLVAGAEVLAVLTGGSYKWMVAGMALTPFCYTFFSGLRTSVFTDALQYFVIATSAALLLVYFPGSVATIDPHAFTPLNSDLLWEFGISSALGLIVAIFADHQQWQRAFAIKEEKIVRTFYEAAAMHGFVTLSLGTFGCLVFANEFQPNRIDLVGFEYVKTHYPTVFTPLFVVMAMCALISTLDSALCAFASLAMKELSTGQPSLKRGRMWMVLLAFTGALIALQRPSLLTLWFIVSTIRLSAFIPTISSIIATGATTKLYSPATMAGLLFGGSIFTIGVTSGNFHIRTAGMILTLVLPGVILGIGAMNRKVSQWAGLETSPT
jgi:Na+/proline symporter